MFPLISFTHYAYSGTSSCELFNKAYNHISDHIDQVYKDLTKGKAAPMGGVAYLSLEDSEVWIEVHSHSFYLTFPQEPYAGGIKYHAMPPMKRFRDMEQLSGGEKTVAALALLFAIHRFVLLSIEIYEQQSMFSQLSASSFLRSGRGRCCSRQHKRCQDCELHSASRVT